MFSTLGYSIIPLFLYYVIILILRIRGVFMYILGVLPICWCLRSIFLFFYLLLAVNLFLSKNMENNKRALVLAPIALYYYFFIMCL